MLSSPRRILPLLGCGFLAACSCEAPTLGALRLVLTADPALPADCFELEVQGGGSVLASTAFDRTAGKTEYLVAALQGDLPATVDFQAKGYLGSCADHLGRKLNGRSAVVSATFPRTGITEVRLDLGPPEAALDADRDGYVGLAQGGVDCDDGNPLVHPLQPQTCVSPLDTDCDGKVGCDDGDCSAQPACFTTPLALGFSPPAVTVHAYDCSAALTLELRDAFGLAPVGQQTLVSLASSGVAVQLFTDPTCSGAPVVSPVVVPFGSATQALYARGLVVGSATLTATSGTLTAATATITVDPQPAAALAFTTAPRTISAGGCSAALTVEAQDSAGRPTAVTAPLGVALSGAPSQGLTFHDATDTACATPRTSVSMAAGSSTVSFLVRGTRAGTTRLTAAGGGFTAGQDLTVNPGPASALGFSTAPPGVQAATCSAVPVTVQLQDGYGNAAPAGAAATVDLTLLSGPSGGLLTFYSAAGCGSGTQTASLTIAAQTSSGSFYLVGSAVGAYTMQASWNAHTATQVATISSGPPNHLAFVSSPVTATAGGCSPSPVRVQTQDVTNAPSGVGSALTVTLAQTPAGAASLYADASCTTALPGGNSLSLSTGATEAAFYFRGTVARSFQVDATAPGLAPASQSETIRPGVPNTLRWNPDPTALSSAAGGCAGPFTLDFVDANGNATTFGAGTALTPSATSPTVGATLAYSAAAGCASTGPTVPIGGAAQSVSFYATTTRAAAYSVSASTPSVSTTAAASLSVGAAAADRLVVTSAPPGSVAAGTCLSVTVERRDAYGNAAPVSSALTLDLSAAGGAALTFFAAPANCPGTPSTTTSIAAGAATATFAVRGIAAGSSATVTVARTGLTSATFSLSIQAAAAATLELSAVPATVNAGQCVALTETRRDAHGNAAPDATPLAVSLVGTGPGATGLGFFTEGSCTNPAANGDLVGGSATRALYLRSTTPGALTITATSALGSPQVATTVQTGPLAQLVFTTSAGVLQAGDCSGLLTVQGRDAQGFPILPSTDVSLTLTSSSAGALTFHQTANCSDTPSAFTIAAGASTAQLAFRPTRAPETPTLTVAANGATSATQQWTVNPGAPAQLAWTTTPIAATRYACTPVTLQLRDALGNPTQAVSDVVAGLGFSTDIDVEVFAASTCSGTALGAPSATIVTGQSSVSFGLVGFLVGSTDLSATEGTAITDPPAVAVTVTGGQGTLGVSAAAANLEAGACAAVTLTRPVSWGATTTVTLASSDGTVTVHPDASCATAGATVGITPGSSSASLYVRGRSAPSPGVTVTLTASEPSGRYGNGSQSVTSLPLVRRGSCGIADAATTNTCTLTPALPTATTARSFLVFQAQGTATSASSAHVECHLAVASAAVNVVCSRVGSTGAVTVNYQVVSWGRAASAGGVTVQHVTQATGTSTSSVTLALSPSVPTSESFVLFSTTATDGSEHSNVFPTAVLSNGSQVTVTNSATFTASTVSAQVVDFAGAVVTRGTVANATLPYSSLAVSGLAAPASADLTKSFVLHSVRETEGTGGDNNAICKRRFSGIADSTTSLLFRRSAGSGSTSNCNDTLAVTELAWERIDLPGASRVQLPSTVPLTLASGALTGNGSFGTAVAEHKSLLLLSGQGPGGQTAGEGSDTGNNPLSAIHGLLSWNSTTSVTVSRLSTTGAAHFYPYVIEFDP